MGYQVGDVVTEKQVEAITITIMFIVIGAMIYGADLIGIARMSG